MKWIVLIAFFLFGYASWYYYTCEIKGFCDEKYEAVKDAPVFFRWSEAHPVQGPKFEAMRDSLLTILNTEESILEVVGQYYGGEVNGSNYGNLGLARANEVKALLSEKIQGTKIQISSEMVEFDGNRLEGYFKGVKFKILDGNKVLFKIEELDDKIVVYFPYDSSNPEMNPNIFDYVVKLAKQLDMMDQFVIITGHTDSKGEEAYNEKLGLERAYSIANILYNQDLDSARITVNSRGELEPLAENETEEGRKKNRRIELFVRDSEAIENTQIETQQQ